QPDPERMLLQQVTFEELRDATAEAVKNTTGGFLTDRPREIMVRNLAMTTSPDIIGETVVAWREDRPVHIRDVADVVWDIEPMRGDAAFGVAGGTADEDGKLSNRGVVLSVRKSPGFDTIALDKEVLAALDELEKSLPEGAELVPLYRQSDFIHLSIDNLVEALRDGAIMVALVLFLFLLNFRITFITLTAIPLSLGITVLVFDLFGLTVNSMTLGGLAVAVGMVVDDAIVDVENVFRRLRENASLATPHPRLQVIAKASGEVRNSILYATVLIILVFLPLLGLTGVEGKLFAPIAIATIISMIASFVVSLTAIPVLCSILLNPKHGHEHKDGFLTRGMKWLLEHTLLRFGLSQPYLMLGIVLMIVIAAFSLYPKMNKDFLPKFQEETALVAATTAPGTSLEEMNKISDVIEQQILSVPEVRKVGRRLGRAERGDHVVPVSTAEFDVDFRELEGEHKSKGRGRKEILDDIGKKLRTIPGVFAVVGGPLADRIGHMLSGVSAKVAVKIFGPDLDELRRIGDEVVGLARTIPGLEEARGEQLASVPQLRIEPDAERAAAYAVTPGALTGEMASLMGGETVAEAYEGVRVYDLVVRLPEEWRENPERLENLYVDTKSGQLVPLGSVADLRMASGPNTIQRENSRRRFVVSINPTVPDLVSAVDRLKQKIADELDLPEGYSISYEGEYQAQKDASRTIAVMSAVILLVVVVLLYSYFRSFAFVALVLTIIPVSLIGAVLSTRFTLDNVSIATLVGFIAVGGIAARNNIMLLSHYLHLMKHEGEGFTERMVIRGTEERLVPILMTALAAGIALIPLVLASEKPGKEILNPIAIVIVGGLVTSTFLGLAVTPALFYRFCRKAATNSIGADPAASI
ncbi:MAG: efflux RND transporter permease subunit, partial [Verrucomicrobiae bacterium]|nr:efflux RND transporter permease subunit [Verrucomicrobiae bacterium]